MITARKIVALAFFSLVLIMSTAFAKDISCSQCGMTVDMGSRFAAKISSGAATLFFCDIGDLFTYLARKHMAADGALVRDYPGGDWIDAQKAFYVHSEKRFKTPMGWGMAAFQDRAPASQYGPVMNYEAAAKALK